MVHSPVSVSRPDLDGAHHRRRDDVLIEKTQLRVRQLARNPIFGEVAGGGRKTGLAETDTDPEPPARVTMPGDGGTALALNLGADAGRRSWWASAFEMLYSDSMPIPRGDHLKWAVPPGLALALLLGVPQVLVRLAHVQTFFPLLAEIERPLRWIERMIWPQQWTFYTPYTTIHNGPPDWLASVLFWGWWILVPFAVGAGIGEAVRLTVGHLSRNQAG